MRAEFYGCREGLFIMSYNASWIDARKTIETNLVNLYTCIETNRAEFAFINFLYERNLASANKISLKGLRFSHFFLGAKTFRDLL